MSCKTFIFSSFLMFSCLFANPLQIGASLPAVSGIDQAGETLELGSLATEPWLMVYFYPKADTPGCTKQACSLRDAYAQLSDAGVKVVGVSADSRASQKAFADKYELPFTLLADRQAKVIKAFGVPQMKLVGLPSRQAYLFKQGKLVWRDLKASTKQQADDVLKQIVK